MLALIFCIGGGAEASSASHVVRPGDTLWKLARVHGCTVDQIRAQNGLDAKQPILVRQRLSLRCGRVKYRTYTVRPGDSLSRIAKTYSIEKEVLRSLNGLTTNMIHPGQRLVVSGGKVSAIDVVKGQSIGRPTRGRLVKAARLGHDTGYYRRRLARTYGTQHLVDYTKRAIETTRALHPKLHRLAIGDISHQHGGWLSGHRSHQSGRDIDIGLFFTRAPKGYPQEFVAAGSGRLHVEATFDLVREIAASHLESGGVYRIFLDYRIQGLLYAGARARGVSRSTLRDLFQYPDGRFARHGIVRHEPEHDDHIHVRYKCPEGDDGCR